MFETKFSIKKKKKKVKSIIIFFNMTYCTYILCPCYKILKLDHFAYARPYAKLHRNVRVRPSERLTESLTLLSIRKTGERDENSRKSVFCVYLRDF